MESKPSFKQPRLWRIKDPRELARQGQLYLPGLELETPKIAGPGSERSPGASPGRQTIDARQYTGPGRGRAGPAGIDWRSEHAL